MHELRADKWRRDDDFMNCEEEIKVLKKERDTRNLLAILNMQTVVVMCTKECPESFSSRLLKCLYDDFPWHAIDIFTDYLESIKSFSLPSFVFVRSFAPLTSGTFLRRRRVEKGDEKVICLFRAT